MHTCNKRFEMRLPAEEKSAAEALAQHEGITVSELIRRALRAYAGQPGRLSEEGRMSVAGLRRRINQIEVRLAGGDHIGVAANLRQARNDAQTLLGR